MVFNENLRVVMINDTSVVEGGAAKIAIDLAIWLREQNIPVTFLAGDSGEESTLEDHGITLETLGGVHVLEQSKAKAFVSGIHNDKAEGFIADWIEKNDTENTVYHVHAWVKIFSPSIFRALKKVDKRLFLHGHDFFFVCPNGNYTNYSDTTVCMRKPFSIDCIKTQCDKRNYFQKGWRLARNSAILHNLNFEKTNARVIAIHDKMIEPFERGGFPPEKIDIVRNPVFPFTKERVQAESNKDVFYIGRLSREKGVPFLSKACAEAKLPMTVIGEGEEKDTVMAENPNAKFLGWKNHDEISELIKDARCLVMPSIWPETFGLVAFEALASGVPIITSETMLISKEIADNGMGFSVNVQDTETLKTVLNKMCSDDALIKEMSQTATAKVFDYCNTIDSWGNEILSCYSGALSVSAV